MRFSNKIAQKGRGQAGVPMRILKSLVLVVMLQAALASLAACTNQAGTDIKASGHIEVEGSRVVK